MNRFDAQRAAATIVRSAVAEAAHSPDTALSTAAAPAVAEIVSQKVAPVILHATNNEPWYQSRVTIGNYVAMLSVVVGPLIGHQFSPEEQGLITAAVTALGVVAGAGLSLYGRWFAKKPLTV